MKYTTGSVLGIAKANSPIINRWSFVYPRTWFNNRWVLELRFTCHRAQNDARYYMLRALHCSRNSPGINPLIGLVMDRQNGTMTSFIRDLPAEGSLYHVMTKATRSGCPVSWVRRAKSCKQVAAAIAQVHKKTFVFGLLQNTPDCGIAVDSNDDVLLYWGFQETRVNCNQHGGTVPPELRHLSTESIEEAPMVYSTGRHATRFMQILLIFLCRKVPFQLTSKV